MSHHSDLIDTTEMYLRTVYELEEEGVVPLRARIAERLGQSGPTVSQTVARMERDGLVHVAGDRHLQLTDKGRHEAVSVMRKHRLAERLLADVIGLEWEDVHIEACRWEHVMSDAVERRILAMLKPPFLCPHGNPIPGLADLGWSAEEPDDWAGLVTLTAAARASHSAALVTVVRISEQLQPDADIMRRLWLAGAQPGRQVHVGHAGGAGNAGSAGNPGGNDEASSTANAGGGNHVPVDGVDLWTDGAPTRFEPAVSDHVFVRVETNSSAA